MKVSELKKLLENAPDGAMVCFDSETRCFHAHLIAITHASVLSYKEIDGSDDMLFCLFPSYNNTTFFKVVK